MNEEQLEKARKRSRDWNKAHTKQHRESAALWYKNNKARKDQSHRAWLANRPWYTAWAKIKDKISKEEISTLWLRDAKDLIRPTFCLRLRKWVEFGEQISKLSKTSRNIIGELE